MALGGDNRTGLAIEVPGTMTGMPARPPRRTVKASDLTTAQAAALAGIKPRTWSSYVARGQAPPPIARIGSTPVWDREQVEHWLRNRPGQGVKNPPT